MTVIVSKRGEKGATLVGDRQDPAQQKDNKGSMGGGLSLEKKGPKEHSPFDNERRGNCLSQSIVYVAG